MALPLRKQLESLLKRIETLEAQVLALQPGHEYRAFADELQRCLTEQGKPE